MNAISPIPNAPAPVGPDQPSPSAQQWQPKASSLLTKAFATTLVAAGVTAILVTWQLPPFSTAVVKTDNAYVRGWTTVISPQVTGYVQEIGVKDYGNIRQGDVLLRIDDRIYRAQVAAAKADLDIAISNLANNQQATAQRQLDITTADAKIASANAQLVKTEADFKRAANLATQGSGSVSAEDATRAARDVAAADVKEAIAGRGGAEQALKAASVNEGSLKADVESAQAKLQLAEINLGYTVVTAPEEGKLSDVTVRRGQFVTSGTQLMFLVPRARWVVANFKEAQSGAIHPGQRAWFFVDALAGARFEGTVEEISPAAGSEFSVLRTDNAIGNFTKIPQRIAVRINIDADQRDLERLGPGMSVEAHVDTQSTKSSKPRL
ncbi:MULTISPECIES: HlyD family secretion protein [unclassified Rhizobium]|uniref:HlyD family secretion protein n=1 Tax=unclassified Rhizobium TaxID=2613769 RepID=UPI001ADBAA53|nr:MULTISPECIES: HlyD family secretion protein [unclassified Rhizobium]MBO9127775.1 HlyD family secretion protein [Rhizobium sp. 16-488-2b]MBO9178237.1 HlyD family secretion protein [Rhizobium sp. 16-488-2a]